MAGISTKKFDGHHGLWHCFTVNITHLTVEWRCFTWDSCGIRTSKTCVFSSCCKKRSLTSQRTRDNTAGGACPICMPVFPHVGHGDNQSCGKVMTATSSWSIKSCEKVGFASARHSPVVQRQNTAPFATSTHTHKKKKLKDFRFYALVI